VEHVEIKRMSLPDELSGLWRVGDAIEKLSFTHIFQAHPWEQYMQEEGVNARQRSGVCLATPSRSRMKTFP
jgi:hypothetical protein